MMHDAGVLAGLLRPPCRGASHPAPTPGARCRRESVQAVRWPSGNRRLRRLPGLGTLPGPATRELDPQALLANESLAQAIRQLEEYGGDGLPVLSPDGQQIAGWVTGRGVLGAVARQIRAGEGVAPEAQLAAGGGRPDAASTLREPPTPLAGYRVLEITINDTSPAAGEVLGTITWPPGWTPVSVLQDQRLGSPDPGIKLAPGDRINVLAPLAVRRDQPGPA